MYVGRLVVVGKSANGKNAVIYRVSSRSFPNRMAKLGEGSVSIVPKPGCEGDVFKNPYIAYNCIRIVGDVAIATNGSHTDPIAEKVAAGMSVRDAMALSLLILDYEKDDYHTPRIAVAVAAGSETGFLGVVRKDGLTVREMSLGAGTCFYVATYERNEVRAENTEKLDVTTAESAAKWAIEQGVFATMTNPVTATSAVETDDGFELATFTPTEG